MCFNIQSPTTTRRVKGCQTCNDHHRFPFWANGFHFHLEAFLIFLQHNLPFFYIFSLLSTLTNQQVSQLFSWSSMFFSHQKKKKKEFCFLALVKKKKEKKETETSASCLIELWTFYLQMFSIFFPRHFFTVFSFSFSCFTSTPSLFFSLFCLFAPKLNKSHCCWYVEYKSSKNMFPSFAFLLYLTHVVRDSRWN